jgi:hypothetical protein
VNESAVHSLTRWDADWYRRIAEHGYGYSHHVADGRTLVDYAFFPLYPGLERLLAEVSGLRIMQAGLVISAVASIVAAAGIFKVGSHLFDDRTGIILVALWSALPIAVVQSMAYSESLFTALTSWSLFAIVKQRYVAAGALALLAGLTRPLGIAIVLTVIVSAALHLREIGRQPFRGAIGGRTLAGPIVGAVLAPLGLLGYLTYVAYRTDDALGYFRVAHQWGNDVDGGAGFLRWTVAMVLSEAVLAGLLVLFALGLLLLQLVWMARDRYPVPIILFTCASVVVAFSTSGYFGSKPRYLLPVFPLLMPLASWLSRIRVGRTTALLAGLAIASGLYGAVWLFGPGPP